MLKFTFSVLLIMSITVACSDIKVTRAVLKPEGDIILPLVPNQFSYPSGAMTSPYNKDQVIIHDQTNNQLIIYNLKSSEIVKSIPLEVYKHDGDIKFNYLSPDSIFVWYNPAYRPHYWHDSTLIRIDSLGRIQNYYSYTGAPVWNSNGPLFSRDSVSFAYLLYSDLEVSNEKIFISLEAYDYGTGDTVFSNGNFPVGGHIDISSPDTSYFIPHEIRFPGKPGNFYPVNFEMPIMTIAHNGNPVYGFAHTADLYEYNIETHKIIKHDIDPSITENTIQPLELDSFIIHYDRPATDPRQAQYWLLDYHPLLKKYIRYAYMPMEMDSNGQITGRKNIGLMILDTNFNVEAETILPYGYKPTEIILDKDLVFWDSEANKKESGHFIFKKVSLKYEPSTKKDILALLSGPKLEKKSGGIRAYVESEFNSIPDNAVVFFVPVAKACGGCSSYILTYFRDHKDAFKSTPLYLIIADDDRTQINNQLHNHNMKKSTSNLLIDDEGKFEHYVDYDFGQSRIFLKQNGKVKNEVIMDPEGIRKLPSVLEDFGIDTVNNY